MKVRTWRDSKEGWVTLKGNQGTCFVEESDRHHKITKSVALEQAFKSGSSTLKQLEVGEPFEMLEAPKTEKKEGEQKMRGCLLNDKTEGWFTFSKFLTLWSPRYRCLRSTELHADLDATSEVRKLGQGELVEAFDIPQVSEAGVVRVKVRAEKDNTVGFATVRDQGTGTFFLDALAPERPSER